MTRAAQLNSPPSRTRAARSGGAVRPSLADCKAVFQAKTSRQPYSKRRYSACKWSRPFLYRKEDNEYHKGKKRHLDWVGRRLSGRRKTRKARRESRVHGTMSDYDRKYQIGVRDLQNTVNSARTDVEHAEAHLNALRLDPNAKHSNFPDERDAVKELFTRRKVIAEGERILASLRRRRTIPDVETFGDIPRDTPNVGLNKNGDGRLGDLNTTLLLLKRDKTLRRHSLGGSRRMRA